MPMPSDNDKIRIATSKPSLMNKVKTNLGGNTEVIYWYIRFNIALDAGTVSEKTMDVTDTDGYIMRTDIAYDDSKHMIVISPLDTYEQNRFYLLSISKKVRSARGQNLRSNINILFKLYDNQISDYKVLKRDVKTPKPRPRPADYDQRQAARRPTNFDVDYMNRQQNLDKMTTVSFSINPLIGILGLLVVLVGAVMRNLWVVIAGTVICLGGVAHLYKQLLNKELRSTLSFNRGVRKFNKQKYSEAEMAFQRSITDNPKNELAKYGLYKLSLYK